MASEHCGDPARSHAIGGAALLVGVALSIASADVSAVPWDVSARVILAETWTDNVTLAPEGEERSEWITELRPGVTVARDGPRSDISFDYSFQALWYANDSDRDKVRHQASGAGHFILAPESLFLNAFTNYGQRDIDPAGRVTVGNLFDTGNRTDVWQFGASPYHTGRWGDRTESLLRYDYRGTRYRNTDPTTVSVQDSDTNAVLGWLGSPDQVSGITWRASGSHTRTDFETAPEFQYDQVSLQLGAPLGPRTRLTSTVGRESDVREDPSAGGLDSSFWYVGFVWSPDERQTLEAQAGERYFGSAWAASYTRRASRGSIMIDYRESPTASTDRVFTDDGVFRPRRTLGADERLDSRVFLNRQLRGTATYEFVRSAVDVEIISVRRTFEDDEGGTDKIHVFGLSYTWRLAPRTSLRASADLERRYFAFEDGSDDRGIFDLRISRELTRVFSTQLSASHEFRNSDIRQEFDANTVSLSVTAHF